MEKLLLVIIFLMALVAGHSECKIKLEWRNANFQSHKSFAAELRLRNVGSCDISTAKVTVKIPREYNVPKESPYDGPKYKRKMDQDGSVTVTWSGFGTVKKGKARSFSLKLTPSEYPSKHGQHFVELVASTRVKSCPCGHLGLAKAVPKVQV
jgi:uncharacterized protein YcnI